MSKTKTILAARKGTISDEPLKFEYSSLIDVFKLFNLDPCCQQRRKTLGRFHQAA